MSVLSLVYVENPQLRKPTVAITRFDERVKKLAKDMLETMYADNGIGLAGPQVGAHEKILVMDVASEGDKANPMVVINPEIVWKSEETSICKEGCLSIPDQFAEVERPAEVKVKYQTETGEQKELHAKGLLATCVQHEMDHLDGILFIDHISKVRRDMLMRKYKKTRTQEGVVL